MRNFKKLSRTLLVIFASISLPPLAAQTTRAGRGTQIQVIVTTEPKHDKKKELPALNREDVMVFEGRDRDQVSGLRPLTGEHAALQLLILLDDASDQNLATQLDDLRQFIEGQPTTTSIAIAYMRNGTAQFTANFNTDHTQATKGLRIPIGAAGVNGSPYFSLSDVVKRWPQAPGRREILMITDGIDRYGAGTGLDNPYVNAAIRDAQRSGIVVFAIYTGGAGHYGHSFWRMNLGQSYLSQVADQTGGESFYIGLQSPVSFQPFLEDLTARLNRQYQLTFFAKPQKRAGLQSIKLSTELPNVELVYPDHVWVPATL